MKEARKNKTFPLRIDASELRRLRKIAKARGLSVAALFREGAKLLTAQAA
jgi:ribbon-helix-helix CopG family protein